MDLETTLDDAVYFLLDPSRGYALVRIYSGIDEDVGNCAHRLIAKMLDPITNGSPTLRSRYGGPISPKRVSPYFYYVNSSDTYASLLESVSRLRKKDNGAILVLCDPRGILCSYDKAHEGRIYSIDVGAVTGRPRVTRLPPIQIIF